MWELRGVFQSLTCTCSMPSDFVVNLHYNPGFGFIRPFYRGDDVFFHHPALDGPGFNEQLMRREVEFDVSRHRDTGKTWPFNVRLAR